MLVAAELKWPGLLAGARAGALLESGLTPWSNCVILFWTIFRRSSLHMDLKFLLS